MKTSFQLIKEVITEAGREAPQELSTDSRLREDLGFDSLELAVLTAKIEAEFGGVDIFKDGIVRTVGEIEAKLVSRGGGSNTP